MVEYGPFNTSVSKTFFAQIVELIKFMTEKGFSENGLFFEDVFVDKSTNSIKIDNYGDRRNFKMFNHLQKQEKFSTTWELATILFTLFNKYPPYTIPNSNDKHYWALEKGNFEKFW